MIAKNGRVDLSTKARWLNSTVLGIGLASLFSDLSHEMATTVMPAFLATMGVAAAWLGFIEGVSDGLSSFAKMASGYYTDRFRRRKPIAVFGYVLTTLGVVTFGLATTAWHVLALRATAWFGRGLRTPVRKALLAAAVSPETYGRAFGFERMMDTLGAIIAPGSRLGPIARTQSELHTPVRAHTYSGSASGFGNGLFGQRKRTRSSAAHLVWNAITRVARRI
jgi:MFS family permease